MHVVFTCVVDMSQYVLAVSTQEGSILLLKHHDDVSPVRINTGLYMLFLEWSNCRQLLCVAGSWPTNSPANTEFHNAIHIYSHTGALVYTNGLPYSEVSSCLHTS